MSSKCCIGINQTTPLKSTKIFAYADLCHLPNRVIYKTFIWKLFYCFIFYLTQGYSNLTKIILKANRVSLQK